MSLISKSASHPRFSRRRVRQGRTEREIGFENEGVRDAAPGQANVARLRIQAAMVNESTRSTHH